MGKNKTAGKNETLIVYGAGLGAAFGAALGSIIYSIGIAVGISIGIIAGVLVALLFGKNLIEMFGNPDKTNSKEEKE